MSKLAPGVALIVFGLVILATLLVVWPRRGLAARLARRFGRSDAVLGEDLLKALLHARARDVTSAAHFLGVSAGRISKVADLESKAGHVELTASGGINLTQTGRARAIELVRAHRLWERYLADRTGLSETEWHDSAERQEHLLSPDEADRLAARIGSPLVDPHGDPIPVPGEDLPELEGLLLSAAPAGSYHIVHLEDEPPEPYERLVAIGLAPGEIVDVEGRKGDAVLIALAGRRLEIATADAAAVTVQASGGAAARRWTLANLAEGQSARVLALSPVVHGPQRRRLLDLGFVPGTEVTAEMRSAMGEPMAFRVRGALIALRREQAAAVWVEAA